MSTAMLLVFGIVGLVVAYMYSQRKPKNFPPGPFGIPVLGNILQLGATGWITTLRWKEKYGPLIGIQFGSYRAVLITDYKLIKDAFNESAFAGRPALPFVVDRAASKQPEGLIFSSGRWWIEQRRFTLRHLRDFGFGTKSMETIVHFEIQELIERFKETAGIPISTTNKFNVAVVNALWTILNGERFGQDDPKLDELIKYITTNISESNPISMLGNFIPWLATNFPKLTKAEKLSEPFYASLAVLKPYVENHFETHEVDHPRDFLDVYIDEIKRTTDPASSFHLNQKTSFMSTVIDLFVAGAETTSTTLTWIFLYMARNQHVQEKLAEEIHRVVGNSRLPSLHDRPKMPYTESVIYEVMRKATMLPMGVFHSASEDTTFQGYFIPKDTILFPVFYAVHNSIELWGDPENFRPERFLSKDGTKCERRDGFMPFSIGKRVCIGETLAKDELFLFTASLFQVFQVDIDKNGPPPSLEPHIGGVLTTKPHKLVLTIRN